MALNKQDKDNLKTALFYLDRGLKDKPEISESAGQKLEISFDPVFASHDEELLRGVAERVFTYCEQYPELMQQLKEKYFTAI